MAGPVVDASVNLEGVHTGVMAWNKVDELTRSLCMDLEFLGCQVSIFLHNEKLPANLDLVLVNGPYGSVVPLANQLIETPPAERPAFLFLMSEQLPNPSIPEWLRYWLGTIRSRLERLAYKKCDSGSWQQRSWMRWATAVGTRFRYYGDLYWFHRSGILSMLVISSYWTGDFLRQRGFDPYVIPIGFTPDEWSSLQLERDVPVLWLGKMGSKRRERILNRIRSELEERGVPLLVIDGVENPYVFGEERTLLLSRTKIVLNLLREKWDDNSMRYALSMPRKALVITEPTLPHTSFVPGKHLIEAPIDKLTDTIHYYIEHEDERQRIADQAYEEITRHPYLASLAGLIEHVLHEREKQTGHNQKG